MALRVVAAVVALSICGCSGASGADSEVPPYLTERLPLTAANTQAGPIRIQNVGLGAFAIVANEAVSVSAAAVIEAQREDGAWTMLTDVDDGAGFQLRASCVSASDARGGKPCIALRAGDVLSPVRLSRGTCQCGECASRYDGGPHRLVVRTCGTNSGRIFGPAFVLPRSAAMEPRWDVTSGVEMASAVRVDLAEQGTSSALIGLYRPRDATRQPVSAAVLSRFVELVRSEKGMDDSIVKRCDPKALVAFELRAPITGVPDMPARETAVVLDFGCAALSVVDAKRQMVSVTYFDHRYDDFVAIAREALPNDREVARLH